MGLFISYKIPRHNNRVHSKRKTVWWYSRGDYTTVCDLLFEANWDSILDSSDIDNSWRKWQNTFLDIMKKCIPRKIVSPRKHLPWITQNILKAMKLRNSLLKAFKRTNNHLRFMKYKECRNRITCELRKAKSNYFRNLHVSDMKTFWRLMKALTRKDSSIPALHRSDSTLVCKKLEKANLLNEQFFGNFNHCNIPDVFSIEGCLVDAEFPPDYFCTEEEFFGLITSLDATKSTGADGISARMLKATALAITPSVTKLFNLSLTSGKFPVDWKFGRIVPIPKSGDPTIPANYRPISILSILSKLLEKHVHQLLIHHLVSNNLLSPCQWGFTEKSLPPLLFFLLFTTVI